MAWRRFPAHLSGKESLDDLVQSCLREVLASLPRLRVLDEGRVFGWLLTILVRKIAEKNDFHDALKRAPATGTVFGPEGQRAMESRAADGPTPSESAVRNESLERLARAFEILRAEEIDVISCSFYLGMRQREIAERLGTSEGAVQMRLQRALIVLRRTYVRLGASPE